MKLTVSVLVAILLAVSQPVLAEPVGYSVDAMHSLPTFTFMHLNLSSFRGRFDKVSGTVNYDPAAHSGSVEFVVDIASVSTGVPMLDNFLRGPRFFDVAKFPTATYKSSEFQFQGDKLVVVNGELTLHGVTKSVKLEVSHFHCHTHQLLKVPSCGADAVAMIKRGEFGLDAFPANDSDDVRLDLTIEALKTP